MANSINLANLGANDIVAINNDVYSGAIKAVAGKIAAGNVTFEIDGKQVNLSDAGCSYLNTNLEPINRAKAEEKPAEVLLLLAAKSTNLIAPSESTNATIKSGALATSFAKGSKELDLAKLSDSDLIRFNHLGKTGEVNVLEVKPGAATIQVDGDVIELGDAAASYIDNNYKEIKMAAAEEDPKKVLFALKAGTTKLVSASLVSNQKIAKGAVDTVFVI
jgi:ribosome-associated translation inhibitor RaiA